MTFKRILVATDFNESAQRALELAVEMCRKFDAELTLVHCWEAPSYPYRRGFHLPVDTVSSIGEAANKCLDEALTELKERVPKARSLLRAGPAWQEILAAATELHADLIVVGTHGRRGLNRMLLGSVAEKVVRMAEAPVLTAHGASEPK